MTERDVSREALTTMPARRFERLLRYVRESRALIFLVLLFAAFFVLTYLIRTPGLQELDRRITLAIQTYRNPLWDAAARLFTFVGNAGFMVGLAVVSVAIFAKGRRPWAAVLCALSLVGHPLNLWIKSGIDRPRPAGDIVQVLLPAIGTSFPSGHAMSAVMFYGFLAFLAWIYVHGRKARIAAVVALVGIALLVGLSRIYVGAHWFSDILGGLTAGLFFVLILAEAYKLVATRELTPRGEGAASKKTIPAA